MATHLCTVFDKNYVVRALALYNSVSKFDPETNFWFLCLDTESKELVDMLGLNNVKIKTVEDIGDSELAGVKEGRTIGEFAFTSKSCLLNYVVANTQTGDMVVFADSDILCYSSMKNFFGKMVDNYNIAVTPHRFGENKKYMEQRVGKYNAGMLFFINSEESRKCIGEWRNQCIDWCYLRYEDGKLGDQMYLAEWPTKYKGVLEVADKGINLGSWNIANYKITENENGVWIDNEPLICYHFHGLKMYLDKGGVSPLPINVLHDGIYRAYTKAIKEALLQVRAGKPDWQYGFIEKPNLLRLLKQKIHRFIIERTR